MELKRIDGRTLNQVRPINFKYDALGYADASILFEIGNTKVLVSVTLQNKVPFFLRGSGTGWLTAEYAMLPSATQKRTVRDSNQNQKNARGVEISRLIGRCLRTVVDLSNFGERTIIIDCDVLQADGGTRVACVTAASMALKLAEARWLDAGILRNNIIRDSLVAISVGRVDGQLYLDLSFDEDSRADADFNFILTESGKIIEIQGTSEKEPLDWSEFEGLKKLAINGVDFIFNFLKSASNTLSKIIDEKSIKIEKESYRSGQNKKQNHKTPFFSIGSRLPEKPV